MSMLDKLKVIWQYCLPQHLISRLVGYLANSENKHLKRILIKAAISRFKINLKEAKIDDIDQFSSFNAFFTRELKSDARAFCNENNQLISPVDGAISQIGAIKHDQIIQAKGKSFSIDELLGGAKTSPSSFNDGSFATIYLAPRDYHRIHLPTDGQLIRMVYIPGRLFSVNPLTARAIPNLFARNERVVCYFKTAFGTMAVILVGAMLVASIKTHWAGLIAPQRGSDVKIWDYNEDHHLSYQAGQEIGQFCFGSTVIVLFPKNSVKFNQQLHVDSHIQLGQPMGTILQNERHHAA